MACSASPIAPFNQQRVARIDHAVPAGAEEARCAFKRAVLTAGITKPVSPHTRGNAFATHLLQSGYDIRTIQELLGYAGVATAMIYTQP